MDIREYLFSKKEQFSDLEILTFEFRIQRKQLLKFLLQKMDIDAIEPIITSSIISSRVHAFQSWIDLQQFPINLVSLFVSDEFRVGAVAKRAIKENEVYLRIPPQVIMDVKSAHACPILGPIFKELESTIGSDPEFELILHLMFETFVKKKSSFYAPYLNLLPSLSEMHSALLYTQEQMEDLICTDLHIIIEKMQVELERHFEALETRIWKKYPQVFPPRQFTWKHFQWASSIVHSRAIWYEDYFKLY